MSLIAPPGWSAAPGEAEAAITAGESGALRFVREVPPGATGRHVLPGEPAVGERRFGQIAKSWSTWPESTDPRWSARPAFGVRMSPERAYDPGQGRLALRPTRAR